MHPEGLRPDAPDLCLVCGLRYSNDYPWGESGDDASYSYCDCCGTEFGAYDNRSGGIRSLRQEWIKGGMQWRDPGKRPQRWDARAQLFQIPLVFGPRRKRTSSA